MLVLEQKIKIRSLTIRFEPTEKLLSKLPMTG